MRITNFWENIAKYRQISGKQLLSIIKRFPKSSKSIFVLILAVMLLSTLSIETTYKLANAEHTNTISTTNAPVKKAPMAPAKVVAKIPLGPAQNSLLFSTYPTWSQNFATESTLDNSYWNVNVGPPQNSNHEAEYYTDNSANLHIVNGALVLEATQQTEPDGYDYASARIDTNGKISFLYGRIDVVAELPDSVGTWPAVWLLPANNTYEDLSPISDTTRYLNGGEIDLIEEVGTEPNREYGIVHSLSDLVNPGGVGDYNTTILANNNTTYNTYSLLWTPNSITFEVNNTPFYTYNMPTNANYTTWPFNQPFYLILNLALGGSWGGDDTAQYPGGIDNSSLPASMSIKSIDYYSYIGSQ